MNQSREKFSQSKYMIKPAIVLGFILLPAILFAQSHNHWTRNFNEESSLLSGAVVGGGAGPSAIYYNPAIIGEIVESKLSVNASLFSYNFLKIKNALGNGVDLQSTRGVIEPRFLSYMVQPKKHPDWSLEFAFLNNENYRMEVTGSVDQNLDVLTHLPGDERYFAYFQYRNIYRDDWFGIGSSWKITPSFYIGASMFISVKSMEYSYIMDIECFPLDSAFINEEYVPFYSANYQEMDYVKYNDYRLLWKAGLLYRKKSFSVGFNFTTPSLGGIYSDGKKVTRKKKQSNISLPETGNPLPNYVIVDFQDKKNVTVDSKSPFSISAGFTYYVPGGKKIFYTTVEYFDGLDPYRIIEANENPSLSSGIEFEKVDYNEWLTYISGSKPILNAAIGYQWTLQQDLMLLAGFRTDFNYRKNFDYFPYAQNKTIRGLDVDVFHITGGLKWNIKKQNLMTGLQYTVGREKNQNQYKNLSDPVEYNTVEKAPLVGTRQNNMSIFSNSLSLYFGATFNFGGNKKDGN